MDGFDLYYEIKKIDDNVKIFFLQQVKSIMRGLE